MGKFVTEPGLPTSCVEAHVRCNKLTGSVGQSAPETAVEANERDIWLKELLYKC